MTQQPEALRLADWLFNNVAHINHAEAAAELRRLHQSERDGWRYAKEWEARGIRLAEALGQAMEALEWLTAAEPGDEPPINEAITTAKQALEDKS